MLGLLSRVAQFDRLGCFDCFALICSDLLALTALLAALDRLDLLALLDVAVSPDLLACHALLDLPTFLARTASID